MAATRRTAFLSGLLVASLWFPACQNAAEPTVAVNDRLDAIIEWTAADDATSIDHVIDCLSDEREIDGATLRGEAKNVWSQLRSQDDVDARDERFAGFVSGKTERGRDRITATRRNIVDLANAIRDSNVTANE